MQRRHPKRHTLPLVWGLALLFWAQTSAAQQIGLARGEVEIGRGEPPAWSRAHTGDALQPGDRIRTGRSGRAEVTLAGATVRLYANSLLRLPAKPLANDGLSRGVDLEKGSSIFDVTHRKRDGGFDVRTPEVVVSVKGTRFSVDADSARVAVYRGTIGVRALAAEIVDEMLVREGFGAQLAAGPMQLFLHRSDDPWDAWPGGAPLPARPDDARTPAPQAHRASVEHALDAAREASRVQALQAAMKRHPELRQRVAEIAAERIAEAKQPVASIENHDRIADDDSRTMWQELKTAYTEGLVTGTTGGGGGSGPGGFNLTLVSGSGVSGGDQIQVELGTNTWLFDDNLLSDVLAGTSSLPPALQTYIQTQGFSEQQMAQLLLQALEGF